MLKFKIWYGKCPCGNPRTHSFKCENEKTGLIYVLRYFTKFGKDHENQDKKEVEYAGPLKSAYRKKIAALYKKTETQLVGVIKKYNSSEGVYKIVCAPEKVFLSTFRKKS